MAGVWAWQCASCRDILRADDSPALVEKVDVHVTVHERLETRRTGRAAEQRASEAIGRRRPW